MGVLKGFFRSEAEILGKTIGEKVSFKLCMQHEQMNMRLQFSPAITLVSGLKIILVWAHMKEGR